MMKRVLFIVFFLMFALFVRATDRVVLDGVLNPQTLEADQKNLYVTCGTEVQIYSLKDGSFKTKFGKDGEGPGEFRGFNDIGVHVDVQGKDVFVWSRGKVSWFSKTGKYIKEKRTTDGQFLKPLRSHYVGLDGEVDNGIFYNAVMLFDKGYQIVKELHRKPNWFQEGKKIDPVNVQNPSYCVLGDRVFVENHRNGTINVFNERGEKLSQIAHDFRRRKVSQSDRDEYHEYYKTHPAYKEIYHSLKHFIRFPDQYKHIKYFKAADSVVYVFTFIVKDRKQELFMFDLNGKLKKQLYVDMPTLRSQDVFPLITVANNTIYQLEEDEDGESWVFCSTRIPAR